MTSQPKLRKSLNVPKYPPHDRSHHSVPADSNWPLCGVSCHHRKVGGAWLGATRQRRFHWSVTWKATPPRHGSSQTACCVRRSMPDAQPGKGTLDVQVSGIDRVQVDVKLDGVAILCRVAHPCSLLQLPVLSSNDPQCGMQERRRGR